MIPAIGIVSISFNLLRRNEYELPILPSFRVDVAIHVFYFRRVTICVVAAAGVWVIRHTPC